MTLKINNLLRVSLIGALAAATVPAIPTMALAAGDADYCNSAFFAGYVRAADVGEKCNGTRTHFDDRDCAADDPFVFVIAERRNGVVYVDCVSH
ncbi:MAG: hypothetical protein KIT43_13590 [Bauldia sp.]|nr:hypothetical protein [Bauldia sp.]MCW5716944.1 hypothetical protein [Bauldia sp.]